MWVLLGAPGAGKGTQAARLAEHLGVVHVSTGELFRTNLKLNSPLGLEARGYMDRGELVPDATVLSMVADRLALPDAAAGAVLDGFPRTLAQAEAFDALLTAHGRNLPQAYELVVPTAKLMERMTGRWVCRVCGDTYHSAFRPPRVAGHCDNDRTVLEQRPDDAPETVARRLEVYFATFSPVVAYYRDRGRLSVVAGDLAPDAVAEQLWKAVDAQAAG